MPVQLDLVDWIAAATAPATVDEHIDCCLPADAARARANAAYVEAVVTASRPDRLKALQRVALQRARGRKKR